MRVRLLPLLVVAVFGCASAAHAEATSLGLLYQRYGTVARFLAAIAFAVMLYWGLKSFGRHSRSEWPAAFAILIGGGIIGLQALPLVVTLLEPARVTVPAPAVDTTAVTRAIERRARELDWMVGIVPPGSSRMITCVATPMREGVVDATKPGLTLVYQQGDPDILLSYRGARRTPAARRTARLDFLSGATVVGTLQWNLATGPPNDTPVYTIRIDRDLLSQVESNLRKSSAVRLQIEDTTDSVMTFLDAPTMLDRFRHCVQIANRATVNANVLTRSPFPVGYTEADSALGQCAQVLTGEGEGTTMAALLRSPTVRPFLEARLRDSQIRPDDQHLMILAGAVEGQCRQWPSLYLADAIRWQHNALRDLQAYP